MSNQAQADARPPVRGASALTGITVEGTDRIYHFGNGTVSLGTVTLHLEGMTRAAYERIMREVQETAIRHIWAEYDQGISTPIALERYELYKYPRFDRKTGRELPPLPRPTRAELRAFHDKLRKRLPMTYEEMIRQGILVEITDEELEAERLELAQKKAEAGGGDTRA